MYPGGAGPIWPPWTNTESELKLWLLVSNDPWMENPAGHSSLHLLFNTLN